MSMTEEGLSRLRAMENQSYYLYTLLSEIENNLGEVLEQEFNYLSNANEIFDTILFGAGCFEDQYLHDKSLNLNDYYILYSFAKTIFDRTRVKSKGDLKSVFDKYKTIILKTKNDHKKPGSTSDKMIYDSAKEFFHKYHKTLSKCMDYTSIDM